MVGRYGKLAARSGQRAALADILVRAAGLVGQMAGCRCYVVHLDPDDDAAVWVYELWDGPEDHAASLQDGRVRALIQEAMPLLDGPPDGAALEVVGGHGPGL